MKPISVEHFQFWLEMYGKASRDNDPQASADLFSQDAEYYETPFDEPMIGRQAIYKYWSRGAKNLKEKESSYEILSMKNNLGIARWQSKFTVIKSGKRLALDCLFLVEFNDRGECRTFREWWHLQQINTNHTNT